MECKKQPRKLNYIIKVSKLMSRWKASVVMIELKIVIAMSPCKQRKLWPTSNCLNQNTLNVSLRSRRTINWVRVLLLSIPSEKYTPTTKGTWKNWMVNGRLMKYEAFKLSLKIFLKESHPLWKITIWSTHPYSPKYEIEEVKESERERPSMI